MLPALSAMFFGIFLWTIDSPAHLVSIGSLLLATALLVLHVHTARQVRRSQPAHDPRDQRRSSSLLR
jgi:hypothetical protein